MRTSETRAFPARLAAFRRRFDHWRKNRTIGSRIPKRPWSAAAEQAEVHGIRRTWCRRAIGHGPAWPGRRLLGTSDAEAKQDKLKINEILVLCECAL